MLHKETRELIIKAYEKIKDVKKVAEAFSVNIWYVYHLAEQKRKTGSV